MPWVNPTVCYVDHLGYVKCTNCATGGEPMDSGNCAVEGERCETCGRVITYDVSLRVQVPWSHPDGHAPDEEVSV